MAKKFTLTWDEKTKKPKLTKEDNNTSVVKDDTQALAKVKGKDPVVVEDDGTVIIQGYDGEVVIPDGIWNHGSGPHSIIVEY